ncbi:MAG: alanyl-tRNA editing protein, partial [Clostridia bacterium]|nr:alanyl-tRNA editing protein [Clostridia bacterium]
MTEKLFYKDSFIKEFEATVLECRGNGNRFEIRLDKTAFFPEGGGQGGDSGMIGNAEVFDTHEKDGEIWHYTKMPLDVGLSTKCDIDFEKRFSRMQCHSGEHIVSGIIHSLFGFDNVGFHLGDSDVTIDINGVLSEEDIRRVERHANEAVAKDFEINIFFPTKEEAAKINYRSKLEIEENLRLVEFPDYDICACCAPHVKRSGQIGVIKLLDFANYKGGVRIHMLCGMRALKDYQDRYHSVLMISNMLSAKQNEVADAVERLKSETEKLKHDTSALRRALADEMANTAKETDGNLVFFAPLLDANSLRTLVNAAVSKCGGICAAFSGSDGAYNFCMASKAVNLKEKSKEIGEALHGRGGGSPEMICGSSSASRAEIEKYF